jgi:diguanylate cyclase (GGDEF)-like protein/PAS domain S-box-containing protein
MNASHRVTRLPIWSGAFVGLICIAILALTGWREWTARNAALEASEVDIANLAQSLVQHANDTFELVDVVLAAMVNRLQLEGTGPQAITNLQISMDLRKNDLGGIRGLFVYGEHGEWLATTAAVNLTGLNNSDRDYFRHHLQSKDPTTFIGRPIRSRSGGEWIITASRRFNRPDGSFAGVVLATVDVGYFSRFFSRFNLGRGGAATLLSSDGIVLARTPDDGSYVGRDLSAAPVFREPASHPASSPIYLTSPLDGMKRLSYYIASDRYPVVVMATKAEDEVLADWRAAALARSMVVVALLAVISLAGFYQVKHLNERQRMAGELAATEADFRLLAEQSSDMVTRIGLDECRHYVSPSSVTVVGWRPEQLINTPALAGVNAEDLPQVDEVVAALKRGDVEEARIVYRTRHRGKNEIWIESTMRVTKSPATGEINGVVAISRDMTEHKDIEQKLATLATMDGLTGIANRRHFDERLENEWARARREGTPLSLLLIDVDHFKKYNDRYGHRAGDDCLRSVARVIADHARRPADVGARYGGEEFVLLLPDTDAEGCEHIAKSMRGALARLAIAHDLNEPSRRVTVSMGGATAARRDGLAQSSSLVEAADRALYAAKDRGRDRLVMSAMVVDIGNSRAFIR